ncbi:MAG: nitrous oxide-stimulated promoter family protein [Paludibacteraceae bacterium]
MLKMEREKRIVRKMISLYCRKKEGNAALCPECSELLAYAEQRLDHCKFGDSKPSCKKCPIHCYQPQMRERMRVVMRYSGPRMVLYSPLAAVRHLLGK